eukprot:Protomagalhaensia_wolfi_Nauph_80__2564@NODE_271_length_2978_cov_689_825111_g202_i0_p3_GENE_NODE_271_length_2978_cov_689_825111_g202_i0NODE_271_length_2978_cov_689_825111_g202_i0_p3_ORF_typecomplete_len151_score9_58AXIN1_TNKS_BD/PF16646_5/1_2e03AXIN1_TNKS_BD/PF16646_5/1_2_NODE_271_length_2978_cov_689_825111_g202_i024612913
MERRRRVYVENVIRHAVSHNEHISKQQQRDRSVVVTKRKRRRPSEGLISKRLRAWSSEDEPRPPHSGSSGEGKKSAAPLPEEDEDVYARQRLENQRLKLQAKMDRLKSARTTPMWGNDRFFELKPSQWLAVGSEPEDDRTPTSGQSAASD